MALRSLLHQPVSVPAISALLCVCGGRERSVRSISSPNVQVRAQLLRYLAPTGARRLHTPAAKEHTTEKVSECVSEGERERERERERESLKNYKCIFICFPISSYPPLPLPPPSSLPSSLPSPPPSAHW